MTTAWPVSIESLRPVSTGAMLWRRAERVSLTIILKATLKLVPDGVATLMQPGEIFRAEKLLGSGPSLYADTDVVPYKPRVDVLYVGNAWAPRPVQALRARLGVIGTSGTLEKTIQVVGERLNPQVQPAPFYRIPMTWDRASTGPKGENPLGVHPQSGRMPNLFDTKDQRLAIGFGAVPAKFPTRRALLGGFDPKSLDAPAPPPNSGDVWSIHVPPSLPFEYFQSAPADQQLDMLAGTESLWLENLVEGASRVHTELPAIKALARVYGASIPPQGQTLELTADTLLIDGVEKTVAITFRGTVPIPSTESLVKTLKVQATIEMPHMPAQWPPSPTRAPGAQESSRGLPSMVEEPTPMWDDDDDRGGSTKAISAEDAMAMIQARMGGRPMPFGQQPAAPPAQARSIQTRPAQPQPSMPAVQPPAKAPPQKEERTLSPAEADALRARLLGKSIDDEPSVSPETTRLPPAGFPGRTPPQAPPQAPPHLQQPYARPSQPGIPAVNAGSHQPAPSFGVPGSRPHAGESTSHMPAVGPPAPSFGAAPPAMTRTGPDLVLRPGGPGPQRTAPQQAIDDEDSSIGSTMAITPEAAAALIAGRRAPPAGSTAPKPTSVLTPGAAMPAASRMPMPAPSHMPMPAPLVAPVPPRPTVNDDGETTGATMALSPEAAARIMEQQKAEIARRQQVAREEEAARQQAAAAKAQPPPEDPNMPRQNTLVMNIPPELADPTPPRRR